MVPPRPAVLTDIVVLVFQAQAGFPEPAGVQGLILDPPLPPPLTPALLSHQYLAALLLHPHHLVSPRGVKLQTMWR